MTAYVIRRVVWGIALLIIVCALTFLLFRIIPTGNPAVLRAESFGLTPEPETPYQRASQAWDERIGAA